MATKRKKSTDTFCNSFFVGVGMHNNFFRFDDLEDDQKKVKCVQENASKTKDSLFEENQSSKRNAFKDKITTYFGEYLPSHVVDALCVLVEENTYDKCHYCSMPTESLVLSVLQILVDANECTDEAKTINFCSKAPADNNNFISIKARPASAFEKFISSKSDNGRHPVSDKVYHQSADKIYNESEGIKSLLNKVKANAPPILDALVFLKELNGNTSVSSQQALVLPINPKLKPNHFIGKLRLPSDLSLHASIANSTEEIIVININFNLLVVLMCPKLRCATIKCFVASLEVNGAALRVLSCSRPVSHIIHWVNQLSLPVMLIISLSLDIVVSSLMTVTQENQGNTFSTLGLVVVCCHIDLHMKPIL